MRTTQLARTRAAVGIASLAALLASGVSMAAPIYSEDFNADHSAAWTVNDPALSDITNNFFYDYSAIGVPAAPGGATTRGLKMTANNSGGVFSGYSVSPNGQSFAGNYRVEFDVWQNYVGPVGPGGSGTTQLSQFGIGTAGNVAMWPGAAVKESVTFAATLDGGSAADYRAYSSAAATAYASGNAVYAPATSNNESNVYYASFFTSQSAPAAQLGLFPGQTGTTSVGEISFKWRHVIIDVDGGFATWSVDGLQMARVDLSTVTLGGGNILFGHADTNAGSSTDVNDVLLNVTLIDSIAVNSLPIPEPASLALGSLAVAGMFIRRRRA